MPNTVGYREKSDQPITQPCALDGVSDVCLMHNTRHSYNGINVTFQVTNPMNYKNQLKHKSTVFKRK